jgi:drug/metabolite transporter (DMT)-like permease
MAAKYALNRNLIILHLTVFVWGFTGILGQLISISAVNLVWYRVAIAFLSLLLYFRWIRAGIRVNRAVFLKLFFTGAIVGLHWILFFESIKLSTISVALVCLSSITLFTSALEPLIKRTRFSPADSITSVMIIAGIYLIFKFETKYTAGIACGLLGSLFASLFSIINSQQVKNRPAPVIAFYELAGAWIWITFYILLTSGIKGLSLPGASDLMYLLLLGTVCTSVAYVAGVAVMKELSAFRVALITNLEPVYGILLAFLIFGKKEQMTPGFYGGSSIVLTAVFLYPLIRNRIEKRRIRK